MGFWLAVSALVLAGVSLTQATAQAVLYLDAIYLGGCLYCLTCAVRLALQPSACPQAILLSEEGTCSLVYPQHQQTARIGHHGFTSGMCAWLPLIPENGFTRAHWHLVFRDQCNEQGYRRLCRTIRMQRNDNRSDVG